MRWTIANAVGRKTRREECEERETHMNDRAYITGRTAGQPKKPIDFSAAARAAYQVQLEQVAAGLATLAALVLRASSIAPVTHLTQDNPNSFILAALYYGDVRAYRTVTSASGLAAPILDGNEMSIILPAKPSQSN